jgi:hypothetical protein
VLCRWFQQRTGTDGIIFHFDKDEALMANKSIMHFPQATAAYMTLVAGTLLPDCAFSTTYERAHPLPPPLKTLRRAAPCIPAGRHCHVPHRVGRADSDFEPDDARAPGASGAGRDRERARDEGEGKGEEEGLGRERAR